MLSTRARGLSLAICTLTLSAFAQQASVPQPPDYRDVESIVHGLFVTPIANAPFSGTVEILSKKILDDGSTSTLHTENHIARSSLGIIYNERRRMMPASFHGEPGLISAHIYDPRTRLSTFYNPYTHVAQERVLSEKGRWPEAATPGQVRPQNVTEESLGTQTIANLQLQGTRKSKTIPGAFSETGKPLVVTDEYWFSPELDMYMIVKHNDPRSGEQIVAITENTRAEPDPAKFQVPAGYRIVDVTPLPDAEEQALHPQP